MATQINDVIESNIPNDATKNIKKEHPSSYKYDVFLSFSGTDTRWTFTGNLYHALRQKRIKTFFSQRISEDDDFETQLSPTILQAIKESRICIVVFSKNYPYSGRCWDELVKINHERINKKNDDNNNKKLRVIPIFYKVYPSDVRQQKNTFYRATSQFENNEKARQWKEAVTQVAGLTAKWTVQTKNTTAESTEYEYQTIEKIVESVLKSISYYHVFLSFCGEDTRYSFTGFLYRALLREGFKTFMDDDGLEGGNQISEALLQAIDRSKLSIVVFSENYGYSTWCLNELVKIMECRETNNQLVWPIFYKIDQSEVSNQTNHYGKAMASYENTYGRDSEKVTKWRWALSQVAFLDGEHIKENKYASEFIKKIVKKAIAVENQL